MINKVYNHPYFGEFYYSIDIPEQFKGKEITDMQSKPRINPLILPIKETISFRLAIQQHLHQNQSLLINLLWHITKELKRFCLKRLTAILYRQNIVA